MNDIGVDINACNKYGSSLIVFRMRSCDKKMIKTLIELGVNIFEPNSKGAYCIQIAMQSAIHISTMEACHIHILSENKDKIWYEDPIIKEYIDSIDKDGKITSEKNHLFHEIKNQDIPRIKVLLALAYKPDKNIDISLENTFGQFPISLAIKNHHDKFGLKLLEMGCAIHDKTSVNEPIVEALNVNSAKWFEVLVKNGADALNEKVGVISRYIESDFYNYNIFKKITKMNIFIESPFQTALYNEYYKCAADIWNYAISKNIDGHLASNKDSYNRIPLSVAIKIKNEDFVKVLLRKCYDCSSADEDGRTPFIYACITNNIDWMNELFDILPVSNLSLTDKYNCSGLFYAANNKRKNFCDLLFINNVDVFECKADKNGIIRNYKNLMNRHKKALEKTERNLEIAYERFDNAYKEKCDFEWKSKHLDEDIDTYNSDCQKFNVKTDYDPYEDERLKREKARIEVEKKSLAGKEKDIINRYKIACNCYDYYKSREEAIDKASRKDILNKISYIEELSTLKLIFYL